jgi:hypothetical protein
VLVHTNVSAKVLLDLNADFNVKNTKPGLSFKWNPEWVELGNHVGYKDLVKNPKGPDLIAEAEHSPGMDSQSKNAKWLRVYKLVKHPSAPENPEIEYDVIRMAPGAAKSVSSDDIDHYIIATYTIQPEEAGEISIKNSKIYRIQEQEYGQISIYVNDRHIGSDKLVGDTPSSFNTSLGRLEVGDTVYIALGPGRTSSIGFVTQFELHSN